jgi:hypothetical protein
MRLRTAIVAAPMIAATLLAPSAQAEDHCVSGDRSVRELYVAPGEVCEFDPDVSSTLRVTDGSILVEGVLRMRPSSDEVVHRIVFENVDEEGFKGAGLGPTGPADPILDSDPGLWAMRGGVLDIVGSRKTGWTRDPQSAVGWTGKCELRVTPTKEGDFDSRPWDSGDTVFRAFNDVPRAEVFNLTRNVVIGGTAEGRAHVFINTDGPQTIKYASFENVGPECSCSGAEGERPGPIVGRWGLHFHMMDDSSRESLVEGVVVTRGAGRGFVPHNSHGVTFRDTIAYNIKKGGYWWDVNEKRVKHETEDTLYDHALAVDTTSSGFLLPDSAEPGSNVIRDSVAAGVETDGGLATTVAGFQWGSKGDGVWSTEGLVSHNNRRNWYRWNNHSIPETSTDTTLYNGQANFIQGAYGANHLFTNFVSRGDLVEWKTASGSKKPTSATRAGMIRFDLDVQGRHPQALLLGGSQVSGNMPTLFKDGKLDGYTGRYAVTGELLHNSRFFDFVRVELKDGSELGPADISISPGNQRKGLNTVIRIQKSNGDAWRINYTRAGRTVTQIQAFD